MKSVTFHDAFELDSGTDAVAKAADNLTMDEADVLTNNQELEVLSNPIIYVRGVPNDSFYLIL